MIYLILIIGIVIVQLISMYLSETRIVSTFNNKTLNYFKKDFKFSESDDTPMDIENIYDCNINNLHECLIDDSSTLFGCKEFSVKCQHFAKDTVAHINEQTILIPHNTDPNKGYALPITSFSEDCNVFHGDYVIVALDTTKTEYMMICSCKEPGFIGNESILGNCTTVHICNGQIDDINKPLNQINCICKSTQKADHYEDGSPICRDLSIAEANEQNPDWTNLLNWDDLPTLDIKHFNPNIRNNLNVTKLINPCKRSILDYNIEIENGQYNMQYKTCMMHNTGIPIHNGTLDSSSLHTNVPYKSIDAVVHSNEYKSLRMIDKLVNVNRRININTNLPWFDRTDLFITINEPIGIRYTKNDDASGGQISIDTNEQLISGSCEPNNIVLYSCYFREYYNETVDGIPRAKYTPPPNDFLWGTGFWKDIESLGTDGVFMTLTGLSFNNDILQKYDNLQIYGYKLCRKNEKNCLNGFARFKNSEDYLIHKNSSI